MASIIKADNIQKVSDGTNIIKKCGSTITLGSTGATIALACGASQTGFGRTGTVDWCTTAKTAPFTGVSGKGYFINTTCGAVTVTLPATPTAGDIISIADYASTFQTNNLTLCNNGSLINGICATAKLSTEGQSITLVYVDGTKGWKNTMDSTSNVSGGSYITATGGTITTCGDYKIHSFTSDGTFCVSAGAGPLALVDYLVVAGGGGGSVGDGGGGGGAGGFRFGAVTVPGCSPALTAPGGIPISPGPYSITVGGGGTGGGPTGNPTPVLLGGTGSNSIFSTITSAGGGGAGINPFPGLNGGSGGGAGNWSGCGGAGNTPPVSPPQGNPGGSATNVQYRNGGGGGATSAGTPGASQPSGGVGGTGASITAVFGASPKPFYGPTNGVYAGGGGGASDCNPPGPGGPGGGGPSGPPGVSSGPGIAGTTNTGGGGGGGQSQGPTVSGGAGGSGIVLIRYKFQ